MFFLFLKEENKKRDHQHTYTHNMAYSSASLHDYNRMGIVLFNYNTPLGNSDTEHVILTSASVGTFQSFYLTYAIDSTFRVTLYFQNDGTIPETKTFDISPNYDPSLHTSGEPIPSGLLNGDISAENFIITVKNLDDTPNNQHIHVSGYFSTLG